MLPVMANFEKRLKNLQAEHRELRSRFAMFDQKLQDLADGVKAEEAELKVPPLPASVTQAAKAPEETTCEPVPAYEPRAKVARKAHTAQKKDDPLAPINFMALEQNFGSVWLVRLGVLLLLTGLVFLSTYAYNHFIVEWGAPLRVTALYVVSLLMLGGGTWLEKSKEALKNYGNVLAAGGLATLYYTSYAAHHVERLQVIESPLVGGLLLTASALACLGYSIWKNSKTTAVISLGLAFYSISINPIGWFTLFSGAVLAVAGIVLLRKLSSLAIGFTTLLGAYLSYAYWNGAVNDGGIAHLAPWFLSFYWTVFTAAILMKRELNLERSVLFASLNNALFLLLFVIDWGNQGFVSYLWQAFGGFGAILIGLSIYLNAKEPEAKTLHQTYLGKGIGLIILAMIVKLSGPALFFSFAVQSGVLFAMAKVRKHELLQMASWVTLALSGYFYVAHFEVISAMQHGVLGLIYLSVGALVIYMTPLTKKVNELPEYVYLLLGFVAVTQAVELEMSNMGVMLFSGVLPIAVYAVSQLVKRRSIEMASSVLYLWTLSTYFEAMHLSRLACFCVAVVAAVHYGASRMRVSTGGQRSWLAVVTGCFLFCSLVDAHKGWEITMTLVAVIFYLTREKGRQLTHNFVSCMMLFIALPVSLAFADSASLWQGYLIVGVLTLPYVIENRMLKLETVNTRTSLVVPSVFLWLVAISHCEIAFDGKGMAVCWAIVTFVLLVSGLLLREATLRVMGLLVMSATLLHVFCIDVWQFGALMRILSFISLGVALLVAGFLYCRIQEKSE